jgi:hypothetical protein
MRESCPFYFSTACCPELISGCASFGFKALTIGAPATNMGGNGVRLLLRVSKKSTVYVELTKGGLLRPKCSDAGASTPFPASAPGAPTWGPYHLDSTRHPPNYNTRRPLCLVRLPHACRRGHSAPAQRCPSNCSRRLRQVVPLQHVQRHIYFYNIQTKPLHHTSETVETLAKHLKTLKSHCKRMQHSDLLL